MRPSQKGWIKNYLNLLSHHIEDTGFLDHIRQDSALLDHDKKLYKLVQPTGLMYGHPIRPSIDHNISIANWSENEKMKYILLDGLINDVLLNQANSISNKADFEECIYTAMNSISMFYKENVFSRSISSLFTKSQKSKTEQIELLLDQRLEMGRHWIKNFWARFFQNSLLFLDIYFFDQWIKDKKEISNFDSFIELQEELRLHILQVIAAAARSNDIIEKEEKALFNFFLHSSNLNKQNRKTAMSFLRSGVDLDEIQIGPNDPWLIRKYMLELAILTVWSDKNIEDVEKEFIGNLAAKIGFSQTELEGSLLAIESFVISNWESVHFLQKKHNILIIKEQFAKRISIVVNKNKKAIVQEIKESKELIRLLNKMTKEELSNQEKSIIKAQLIDVLKTLPTFVIIALPGTFITLPLLLNILPKSAFPSAFSEID